MTANSFIHLRSHKFPVLPGEEAELVNDGIYGKALALYLQANLQQRAWDVPFVCCEDWGWWVEVNGQPFAVGLCIHGIQDDSELLDLCVTVQPARGRKWSWSRFRFVDTTSRAEELFAELKDILTHDSDVEILGYTEDLPIGQRSFR